MYHPRMYCKECDKIRLYIDGECVACKVIKEKLEEIRINDAFCNLDPEE